MNQPMPSSSQTVWLPVSEEDMITLPKEWKDRLGIENGTLVKAILEDNRIIIEVQPIKPAPHRVYTDEEIDEFLEEDRLPEAFVQTIQDELSALYK